MKYYCISDIHIDFFIDLFHKAPISDYQESLPYFEDYYRKYMLPAERLIIAGDVANDFIGTVNFLRWVATKYQKTYFVFGNHDLVCRGCTFGNGNPHHTSEKRMKETQKALSDVSNLVFLEGTVADGIGGCMGMCDLQTSCSMFDGDTSANAYAWKHDWFDGKYWNYMNIINGKYTQMNPLQIWRLYSEMMDRVIEAKPKIMVTHFAPVEIGTPKYLYNCSSAKYFFFSGKRFLDKMEDGSHWIFGHCHELGVKSVDYVNKSGHTIHLHSVAQGYPGDNPYYYSTSTIENRIIEV